MSFNLPTSRYDLPVSKERAVLQNSASVFGHTHLPTGHLKQKVWFNYRNSVDDLIIFAARDKYSIVTNEKYNFDYFDNCIPLNDRYTEYNICEKCYLFKKEKKNRSGAFNFKDLSSLECSLWLIVGYNDLPWNHAIGQNYLFLCPRPKNSVVDT